MSRNRYSSDGRLMDYYSRKRRWNFWFNVILFGGPVIYLAGVYLYVVVSDWLKSVFGG